MLRMDDPTALIEPSFSPIYSQCGSLEEEKVERDLILFSPDKEFAGLRRLSANLAVEEESSGGGSAKLSQSNLKTLPVVNNSAAGKDFEMISSSRDTEYSVGQEHKMQIKALDFSKD